jgi:NAD+ diphosphatase
MLVEHVSREHGDRLLLGRQPRFPAGRYSALAGFIEPGESIEEAVAREVHEEAGVRVRDVRYVASQPWPFPSSLMIGCHAHADDDAITVDRTELEDARWFSRAEVVEALAAVAQEDGSEPTRASFGAPPRTAVAHHLLQWWVAQPGR